MRVTIDVQQKTITLLSSFKHEEYVEFMTQLPVEWKTFEFKVEDNPAINWYPHYLTPTYTPPLTFGHSFTINS